MGDVGRWLPQEWSEIELAALHNQIAGKVAGRRCYENGAKEGAAGDCRCQRRRAAGRRLLLLGGCGG